MFCLFFKVISGCDFYSLIEIRYQRFKFSNLRTVLISFTANIDMERDFKNIFQIFRVIYRLLSYCKINTEASFKNDRKRNNREHSFNMYITSRNNYSSIIFKLLNRLCDLYQIIYVTIQLRNI